MKASEKRIHYQTKKHGHEKSIFINNCMYNNGNMGKPERTKLQ